MDKNVNKALITKHSATLIALLLNPEPITKAIFMGVEIHNIINDYNNKKESENIEETIKILNTNKDKMISELKKLDDNEWETVNKFILPKVFHEVKKEDEKEKIKYIMQGFLYSVNNKIYKKDIILLYYDVLNQLRALDIKILESLDKSGKVDIKFSEEVKENISIPVNYIYYKLEKLNILDIAHELDYLAGLGEETIKFENIKISKFGEQFINFIFNREF
ncbi:hypothetical protein [Clostridium akagii]|uniref:hypothetical protein n=1 Tax=Clostridium akagii TaxID=91623 RepID=UPI00047A5685|nr:hypothetical protein [Clostridium akagii]